MDKKKIFMIGAGILLLIIVLRNITFVNTTPVETTKTTKTVVYKQPVQKAYYVPPAGNYNSYKAQYYN